MSAELDERVLGQLAELEALHESASDSLEVASDQLERARQDLEEARERLRDAEHNWVDAQNLVRDTRDAWVEAMRAEGIYRSADGYRRQVQP